MMYVLLLVSFLILKSVLCQYLCLHKGVDIDAATESGIKVARIPGDITGNAASCAEMAIYLILGLLRKQVGFVILETDNH